MEWNSEQKIQCDKFQEIYRYHNETRSIKSNRKLSDHTLSNKNNTLNLRNEILDDENFLKLVTSANFMGLEKIDISTTHTNNTDGHAFLKALAANKTLRYLIEINAIGRPFTLQFWHEFCEMLQFEHPLLRAEAYYDMNVLVGRITIIHNTETLNIYPPYFFNRTFISEKIHKIVYLSDDGLQEDYCRLQLNFKYEGPKSFRY